MYTNWDQNPTLSTSDAAEITAALLSLSTRNMDALASSLEDPDAVARRKVADYLVTIAHLAHLAPVYLDDAGIEQLGIVVESEGEGGGESGDEGEDKDGETRIMTEVPDEIAPPLTSPSASESSSAPSSPSSTSSKRKWSFGLLGKKEKEKKKAIVGAEAVKEAEGK